MIGIQVVRFQEESAGFDDVAAQILAVQRGDLPCMTLLLFGGAASVDQYSPADIALECGFGTQSRLTTRFKRRTGFTPAEYRRGRSRAMPT